MARKGTVPPSTLAAQILRSKGSTQTDNNFDQLLKDFLSDPVVDSGKLQENARFVTSLAEAVSEYRLKNEPFTPNQGKEQAANCLQAIQITIERHPEILLYNGEDGSKTGSQPPLILWMVTKLLSIAAKESLTGLWSQLIDVLIAVHKFSSQGSGALSSGSSMQLLIRDTAEGKFFATFFHIHLSHVILRSNQVS
jgi:serine/threonine-protein kinase ATR